MATFYVHLEDETGQGLSADAVVDCVDRESAFASAVQAAVDVLDDDLQRGNRQIKLRIYIEDSCGGTVAEISVAANAQTF